MLVICEDCAKKYNIDESRIKGNRARFTCNECGHIIIVDKADLSRSLISSNNSGESSPSSSTVDLLREMEAPITKSSSDSDSKMTTQNDTKEDRPKGSKDNRRLPYWKYRGIPVAVYIFGTMLFTLLCISLITGYLYTEHLYAELLADTFPPSEDYRSKLMLKSSLAFGAVWLFVLLILSIVARKVHAKFIHLVKNANQLAIGQYNMTIVKKGPREVRDLAFALDRIRERCESGRCQPDK